MAVKSSYCVLGIAVVISALLFPTVDAKLTDEEKEEIVNAHNHFRGKVDPVATNMEVMVRKSLLLLSYIPGVENIILD